MEILKMMKENIVASVQAQMGNLQAVDAKELGEAIDMIKDLSEAMYYCSIVEAMEEKAHQEKQFAYYVEPKYPDYYPMERDMDKPYGKMYYPGGGTMPKGYKETPISLDMRDRREGRSPASRKSYMESKEMHHDKSTQLKELEKYMQELTQDIVEMIEDSSPEEKQYLEKRISALATKIAQTNA